MIVDYVAKEEKKGMFEQANLNMVSRKGHVDKIVLISLMRGLFHTGLVEAKVFIEAWLITAGYSSRIDSTDILSAQDMVSLLYYAERHFVAKTCVIIDCRLYEQVTTEVKFGY